MESSKVKSKNYTKEQFYSLQQIKSSEPKHLMQCNAIQWISHQEYFSQIFMQIWRNDTYTTSWILLVHQNSLTNELIKLI